MHAWFMFCHMRVMSFIVSSLGLVSFHVQCFFSTDHTFEIDCPFLIPTIFPALPNSVREEQFGIRFFVIDV